MPGTTDIPGKPDRIRHDRLGSGNHLDRALLHFFPLGGRDPF